MGSGILQFGRQLDVGRLVEASPQLDHHGHLLAVARRLDEGLDDARVRTGPVEGLADRQHPGIACRLSQQIDDRGEGLEGVVQQHVALADDIEQVGIVAQAPRQARGEAGEFQIGPLHHVGDGHQPVQVDRAVHLVDIVRFQGELVHQEMDHLLGTVVGHLKPHRLGETP